MCVLFAAGGAAVQELNWGMYLGIAVILMLMRLFTDIKEYLPLDREPSVSSTTTHQQ
jgi:hypothetical protein